jgi:hypothetical protein
MMKRGNAGRHIKTGAGGDVVRGDRRISVLPAVNATRTVASRHVGASVGREQRGVKTILLPVLRRLGARDL